VDVERARVALEKERRLAREMAPAKAVWLEAGGKRSTATKRLHRSGNALHTALVGGRLCLFVAPSAPLDDARLP
jgi:hypothetical protein